MKRIAALLLFASSLSLHAQVESADKMTLNYKDGSQQSYDISNASEITFAQRASSESIQGTWTADINYKIFEGVTYTLYLENISLVFDDDRMYYKYTFKTNVTETYLPEYYKGIGRKEFVSDEFLDFILTDSDIYIPGNYMTYEISDDGLTVTQTQKEYYPQIDYFGIQYKVEKTVVYKKTSI